jgi:hypothetical protein
MRIVNKLIGRLGTDGVNGLSGVSVSDFDYLQMTSPMSAHFLPNKIAKYIDKAVSWSRTRPATDTDRYGNLYAVGGDSIDNRLIYSEDFSQWQDPTLAWTIFATGISDPLGGSNATRINIDQDVGSIFMGLPYNVPVPGSYTGSFWIRENSGTVTEISIQKDGSSPIQVIPVTVTTSWQRVSLPYVEDVSGTFYINVRGAPGTKFDIFGAQVNTGSALTDYISTSGAVGSAANPDQFYRANELGYLIELEKENVSPWSEDLSQSTWAIADADLVAYTGADPLGNINQNIQLNSTGQNPVIKNDVTVTQGQIYTVSFFAKLLSGNIESINATCGGSASVEVEGVITSEWQRFSAEIEAGAAQELSIIFSNNNNSSFLVWGVQCELDALSSYIPTALTPVTRDADIVTIDVLNNMQSLANKGSVIMSFGGNLATASGTILTNGLTGASEFTVSVSDGSLFVKVGETTRDAIIDGDFLSLSWSVSEFTGSLTVTYFPRTESSSLNFASSIDTINDTIYIGSNNGSDNLSVRVKNFYFYPSETFINSVRAFIGSDYDNANS